MGKPWEATYSQPETKKPWEVSYEQEEPKPEEELPERTWKEAASDVGISAAKGIIGVPQALVGLADIAGTPFGVSPGKYLEEKGYDFEKNQKLLSEQYSPRQKAEIAALSKAEGFTGNILSAIEYPSAVGGMLMESAAPMVAGGIMGKVAKVAAGLETAVAAGAGEGLIGAGSAAAAIRSESEDKELSGKGAISALGSGVGTALFGYGGSKLTTALGGIDVDTLLVGGAKKALAETVGEAEAVTPSMFRRVVTSTLGEGVLEEAPQSAQEKMFQNYATDKPLLEGVEDAAIKGGLLGSIMGGTVGAISGGTEKVPTTPPPPPPTTTTTGEVEKKEEPTPYTEQEQYVQKKDAFKYIVNEKGHSEYDKLMGFDYTTPEGIAEAEAYIGSNSKKLPRTFRDEAWDNYITEAKAKAGVEPTVPTPVTVPKAPKAKVEPVPEAKIPEEVPPSAEAERYKENDWFHPVHNPEGNILPPASEAKEQGQEQAAPVPLHTPETLIEGFKTSRPTNFSNNTQVKKALTEQGVPEEQNTLELQQQIRAAHNAHVQSVKEAPAAVVGEQEQPPQEQPPQEQPPQEQPPQDQGEEEAKPLTIDHVKLKSYDDALDRADEISLGDSKRAAKSFIKRMVEQGLLNEGHLENYNNVFKDKDMGLEDIMSEVVADLQMGREYTATNPVEALPIEALPKLIVPKSTVGKGKKGGEGLTQYEIDQARVNELAAKKAEQKATAELLERERLDKEAAARALAKDLEKTNQANKVKEAEAAYKKKLEEIEATKKANIEAQAKKVEAERIEREAKNYTPFKAGEDIAFSEGVSPELRGVIEGWKKLLGIKERIYFTTSADADASTIQGEFATIEGQTGKTKNGSEYRTRNGNYVVTFKDDLDSTLKLEIISHEMGHVLQDAAFNNADAATKAAIKLEFSKWLKSMKGKTAEEHVRSLRSRMSAEQVVEAAGERIDDLMSRDLKYDYWHSFSEWFADQTARWATTEEKPLTVVEKFFSKLGQTLKRFYKTNKEYLPSKTMRDWLNKLGTANITPTTNEKRGASGIQESLSSTEQVSQTAREARTKDNIPVKPPSTPFYKNIAETISNAETKYLSYDAKFINTLRGAIKALGLPVQAMQKLMLQASQSQTVQATATAGAAAVQGDIKYNPNSFNWEAVDGKHTMPEVRRLVEDIAKAKGETFATINKIFSDIMVASRIAEIYKKADAVKAQAKSIKDKAKKAEFLRKNRHHVSLAVVEQTHMSRVEVAQHLQTLAANPEYQAPLDEWQGVRKSVVDFLVKSGRYSPEQAANYMDAVAYVPFQRIMHDRDVDSDTAYVRASEKKVGKAGLSAGQRERAMKGSAREVDDIISNMEKWVVNSYIKGIKAAKSKELIDLADSYLPPGAVTELSDKAPREGAVTCYRHGVKEYWHFKDPFMTFAFNGINNPLTMPTLKTGAKVANKLREYIVLNPLFTISQLPQDTFAAIFSSGVKHPFALPFEVIKEFGATLLNTKQSKTSAHEKLKAIGATGQKDFIDSFASSIHDIAYGGDVAKKSKLRQHLEHIAMAGDNAVRQAVYNRTLKEMKGNPNAEAIAQERAFEVINFRRKGASASLDAIRQITPFFGAYLQAQRVALNVLSGRGISPTERKEAMQTLAITTAKVVAFTMLYNMVLGATGIGGDDEEEADFTKRNIKDRDKKMFIPGTKATLPLRQDVFSIPFILSNHAYQYMFEKGTKNPAEAWKAVGEAVLHTLPGIGMPMGPTIAKPFLEVAINHDFFTGRDITPQRLQGKDTSLQYNERTSEVAKMLGKTGFINPMDVDHLVKGLTGYVGGGVLLATDMAIRAGLDTPYMDKGVLGKGVRDIPGMTSLWAKDYDPQDVDTYYKMRTEVDKANDTYNTLKKLGKHEKAREYKQEHRTELKGGVKTQLNKMVSKIDTINEKIRKLAEIPNERMSPEAKRARRDQLDAKIRHIQSGVERLQKKVYPE